MQMLAVFYQAENHARVEHASFPMEASLADVHEDIRRRRNSGDGDIFLFLEDIDEPAALTARLRDVCGPQGLKVHVHRCLRIEVSVTFNGRTEQHKFAPSATVARIKRWSTEKVFHISPEQAAEHVLQIVGTTERPSPGTHVGSLTVEHQCLVRFDLVPNERVNGAPGACQ